MIEINKEYVINIEELGYEGEGIGKIEGCVVFVPGALTGEEVKIKIIKSKKNYAVGQLVQILKKGENRITAPCAYFQNCGGCAVMNMSYENQLKFKHKRVKDCIERIAKINPEIVESVIGMDNTFSYRNKVQYQVDFIDNKIVMGFYNEKSYKIVDVDNCLVQPEEFKHIITVIKDWMKEFNICPAKRDGVFYHKGLIRNIVLRKGFKTNEIMVVLVTLDKKIPHIDELISKLNKGIHNIKSVIQNINNRNTNWVMGEQCITLYGKDYITDYIGKYKFNISALSFFQVNPSQTEVLYNKALEFANLSGDEIVFDAYCGTGTITLFLSQKAKKVYGVEIIKQAIKNAEANARINNVSNVEFVVGRSEDVIPDLINKGIVPDVILVDPPRKGCDKKLLKALCNAQCDKIVYVSCDPGTLARDLKILAEEGNYNVCKVQPVDMFFMTKHVECVVLMSRKDK